MQGNYQERLKARRAQRGKDKLRLAARISGDGELVRSNAYGVRSVRIIEAQEMVSKAAFDGKLRCNGGDVAPGALQAASRK